MRRSGFTIVELLVVVVVVAILATITVVSYTRIQSRAKNAAMLSSARQINQAVSIYKEFNGGAYPSTVNNLCMTIDNKCTDASGTTIVASNTTLVDEIKKIGSLPDSVPYASGIRYAYNAAATVDGVSMPAMMVYNLSGSNQACSGNTVTGAGPAYTRSTTAYSSSNGTVTLCIVPL